MWLNKKYESLGIFADATSGRGQAATSGAKRRRRSVQIPGNIPFEKPLPLLFTINAFLCSCMLALSSSEKENVCGDEIQLFRVSCALRMLHRVEESFNLA